MMQVAIRDPLDATAYEDWVTDYETPVASRWQFFWVCCLILSFCYEIAIYELTTMDRLNPRLFDIVLIVGIVTVLPGLRKTKPLPKVFRIWAGIVVVFVVCAFTWVLWIPIGTSVFSIFYAIRYSLGLLAIFMVSRMSFTARQKRILHWLITAGGIVVAAYAVPEYLRGATTRVLVAKAGKETTRRAGEFYSCLGASYFHVTMFSSLASIMTFAHFNSAKSTWGKILCIVLGVFVGWPAFFSGARTGLVATLFGWTCLFFLSRASFKAVTMVVSLFVVTLIGLWAPTKLKLAYWEEKSSPVRRLVGAGSEIEHRLALGTYSLEQYSWQGWRVPFIGAGFYVAPHTYPGGERHYRIGYGIHNIYFFALEQGGLLAFVLFFVFLYVVWKQLRLMRKTGHEVDRAFAVGMLSFFYALLLVGVIGQVFWQGFDTVNFNTYQIILFVLATTASLPTSSTDQNVEFMYEEL